MAPRLRSREAFACVAAVFPHLGVHGGRVQHRAAGRQQRGGQQVPGHPGRSPCHQVGRSGRDENKVGRLAQPDMGNFGHPGPRVGGHWLAGQRGPRRLADEPERIGSRHHPDTMPGLGE